MSWRGVQPRSDKAEAKAWASHLGTETYRCRVCGWTVHYDGMVYDRLLHVCSQCVARLSNLYHRRHGGSWWHLDRATDEDLEAFGETRTQVIQKAFHRVPSGKAKISNRVRFKVYERDGFKCVYCGARKNLSLDHVTAEASGGSSDEGNLVTACRSCNSQKHTKSLADFWEGRE